MIDKYLLPLAQAQNATYSTSAPPEYENFSKTAHVFHRVVCGMNAFIWEGTIDLAEWLQDFNPLEVPDEYDPQIGLVHQPSLDNCRDIVPLLLDKLQSLGWPPFLVCGHSKGAREAPICHALMKAKGHPPLATRLFEPPRPGGRLLAEYIGGDDVRATQTWNVHGTDIFTLVPDGDPLWCPAVTPLRYRVQDSYGIAEKHRMPGVIVGIQGASSLEAAVTIAKGALT